MKREDVKNKIPWHTDEQLNWIMQENGADINREKSAATGPADPAGQRQTPSSRPHRTA